MQSAKLENYSKKLKSGLNLTGSMSKIAIRLRDELFMFLLFLLALVMVLCLISYSPGDPGWSYLGSNEEISNLGGKPGAFLADLGLQSFGYTVYLIPITIALFGWNYFRRWNDLKGDHLFTPILFFLGFVLAMIGGSGLEHLLAWYEQDFYTGGVVGFEVAKSALFYIPDGRHVAIILFLLFLTGTWAMQLFPWMLIFEKLGNAFFGILGRIPTSVVRRKASESVETAEEIVKPKRRGISIRRRKEEDKRDTYVEPVLGSWGGSEPEISEYESAVYDEELSVQSPEPEIIEEIPEEMPQQSISERTPESSRPASPPKPKSRSKSVSALPRLTLLDQPDPSTVAYTREDIENMSNLVEETLGHFRLDVAVRNAHPGPVVTQLEVEPAAGLKASAIVNLSRDLARSLSVGSVRVVDNVPGSPYVGVEVPNPKREIVKLVDGLKSADYTNSKAPLTIVLGKDIRGGTVVSNLAKMPHLLIAGTTGAGKSVCLNAILLSLLYKSTADDVRLIMVDPKMLEFSVYAGIPHLLTPVITDLQKTENALRWCVTEMERRFRLMAEIGTRNLEGYNEIIRKSETPILDPTAEDPSIAEELKPMPYIVFIIDELADLIMVLQKKAEELIIRIAQRARAAGIHLIVATQRPSTDVIKGILKANIPTRIGFKVASNADSRTILDQPGAETLLGQGDMLFIPPGSSTAKRVHGAFVSDDEVKRVVDFLKEQGEPQYDAEVIADRTEASLGGGGSSEFEESGGQEDDLYNSALYFVAKTRKATISSVQRHLRIGYNRAARIIEAMEESGAIGPVQSGGKREVFVEPPD